MRTRGVGGVDGGDAAHASSASCVIFSEYVSRRASSARRGRFCGAQAAVVNALIRDALVRDGRDDDEDGDDDDDDDDDDDAIEVRRDDAIGVLFYYCIIVWWWCVRVRRVRRVRM
jgi:hypothetical protein